MKLQAFSHAVVLAMLSGSVVRTVSAQTSPPPAAAAQTQPPSQAAASPAADASSSWTLHEQATWIDQGHASFNSPYEGPNSLTGESESDRTFSFSLFSGYRVWPGTELYFEPEVFQGHGLSLIHI